MVPERKENKHRFVQYQFEGIDKLTDMVIDGKLPGKQYCFVLWMSSYAWDTTTGKRNPCTFSRNQLAEYFDVRKETIGKWLKNLDELEITEIVYVVHYPKTNKKKRFTDYNKAFGAIKGECAEIAGLEVQIICPWLRVKTAKGTPQGDV